MSTLVCVIAVFHLEGVALLYILYLKRKLVFTLHCLKFVTQIPRKCVCPTSQCPERDAKVAEITLV